MIDDILQCRREEKRQEEEKKKGLDAFASQPVFFLCVCVCAKSDGLIPDSYILALLFESGQVSGHCDLLRKRDPKGQ